MKKLSILKAETFESIVEKIKTAVDADITLRVPRGSILAENFKNLKALAKEIKGAGKNLSIETVDDRVIEFASRVGIESFNPFFSKTNQFSDIVASKTYARPIREVVAKTEVVQPAPKKVLKSVPRPPVETVMPSVEMTSLREPEPAALSATSEEKRRVPIRVLLFIVGFVCIVGGGVWFWTRLASATITITREKYPWNYSGQITIDSRIKDVTVSSAKVPGELFTLTKIFDSRFPASGSKQVEEKAKGMITIYNAYSTTPQFLIKNTRFQAPDGKIFRITQNVTVPGGKVVAGKFIPSSIDAAVVADVSGEGYNIPATSKFTIPGFGGTPKYAGFYGASKSPMTGGFIGTVTYPTPEDLTKAESEFSKTSESALQDRLLKQVPRELQVSEGARAFRFLSKQVDSVAGADKKFGIKGEAELRIIAFRSGDVSGLIGKLGARAIGMDKELNTLEVTYEKGQFMTTSSSAFLLPVTVTSTFVEYFDTTLLTGRMAGRSKTELRTLDLPGVTSMSVSINPFWFSRVPKDPARVSIHFE